MEILNQNNFTAKDLCDVFDREVNTANGAENPDKSLDNKLNTGTHERTEHSNSEIRRKIDCLCPNAGINYNQFFIIIWELFSRAPSNKYLYGYKYKGKGLCTHISNLSKTYFRINFQIHVIESFYIIGKELPRLLPRRPKNQT